MEVVGFSMEFKGLWDTKGKLTGKVVELNKTRLGGLGDGTKRWGLLTRTTLRWKVTLNRTSRAVAEQAYSTKVVQRVRLDIS